MANEHSIRHSNQEKLLGCIVSNKLKWRQHLLENEQLMVRQLTSRVNGLVVLKICYLIQFWGGSEDFLLHSLQENFWRAVAGLQ